MCFHRALHPAFARSGVSRAALLPALCWEAVRSVWDGGRTGTRGKRQFEVRSTVSTVAFQTPYAGLVLKDDGWWIRAFFFLVALSHVTRY